MIGNSGRGCRRFLWGGHGLGHQTKPDVLFCESGIVCQTGPAPVAAA
ncbi:hypothetical protein D8I24_6167 [Cupriavidus necator H850]|nr:hypothetical protein D8I24_6167 [Cupriavidus necator H850]